jgi:hypothetical protein
MPMQVTELDFRMPQFKQAKVEDYEFAGDEVTVVRKDRWERAVGSIRSLVGITGRAYELDDIVEAVRVLAQDVDSWTLVEDAIPEDLPGDGVALSIRLCDGSVLKNAVYVRELGEWYWGENPAYARKLGFTSVNAWREEPNSEALEAAPMA